MNTELRGDTDQAGRFLEWLRPSGPWILSAKEPDGPFETATFAELHAAKRWIEARNGRSNLYVMINPGRPDLNSKASKSDVEELALLHVDLDVKQGPIDEGLAAIRTQLEGFRLRPSGVIFSGGGYWGFWRLDKALYLGGQPVRVAEAEAYNRALERELSGDHCHNVDRICRLPGTVNIPDGAKARRGRVPALAEVVWLEDHDYSLGEFEADPVTASADPLTIEVCLPDQLPIVDVEKLTVEPRIKMLIVHGEDPDDPSRYKSRSEVLWAVLTAMIRADLDDATMAAVVLDRDYGISAHCLSQSGNHRRYVARQIERARKDVAKAGEPFQTDEKSGARLANQHNVRLALARMGVTVRFDTFADRPALDGLPGFGPHLGDAAMARLWLRVIEEYQIKVPREFFWTVVEDAARREAFHPVVDYLSGLQWDGVARLDHWMSTYLGADDSEYTRHVGAIMLTAAVRRVRCPGCKFDEMVVFESEQGKSKSTALSILAVREDWFSDDLPLGAESKVVIERTQGRWIIEAAELAGMGKKSIEGLKAFLSRRVDRSRMAYGRLPNEAPRHFIVAGTTNDDRYLSDSTGNRRFWPVRVGDIDLVALERDRDQLWAEAAAREAAGASIRLDRALWQAAAVEQDGRRLVDPFVHVLADVFGNLNGKVLSREVWEVIGTPVDRRTPQLEARLGASMRELGFEHGQRRFGGNPEAAYMRGTPQERMQRIKLSRRPDSSGGEGAWSASLQGQGGRQADLGLGPDDQPY